MRASYVPIYFGIPDVDAGCISLLVLLIYHALLVQL